MESASNPYAPPKAQDLELPPEAPPDRCQPVEWACKLMWIGLGLSTLETILTTFLDHDSSALAMEIVGAAIGLTITFAIVLWFTVKLRAGRNWMRWLVTILTALGVLAIAFIARIIPQTTFAEIYAEGPLTVANMGIQLLLSVAEVVLINTPAAREWFRARSLD
jgi:hypothetical protein